MKRIFIQYFGVFVSFSALFIFLFHTPLLIGQSVLFYRGLGFLLITALFVLIILAGLRFWIKLNAQTVIAAVMMSLSFNLAFFIVFPVTFERSVTIYLLNRLNLGFENKTCPDKGKLEKDLIDNYVIKNQAVQKRVIEQKIINTVSEANSCIAITQRGRDFLEFARFINKIYAVK